MKNHKKCNSKLNRNHYIQKKKSKTIKYPYKEYKITFVSFDNPKIQNELDEISYREYLKNNYNGNYSDE